MLPSAPVPTEIFNPLTSITRLPLFAIKSLAAFVASGGFVASSGSFELSKIGRHSHQSPSLFFGGSSVGFSDQRKPVTSVSSGKLRLWLSSAFMPGYTGTTRPHLCQAKGDTIGLLRSTWLSSASTSARTLGWVSVLAKRWPKYNVPRCEAASPSPGLYCLTFPTSTVGRRRCS